MDNRELNPVANKIMSIANLSLDDLKKTMRHNNFSQAEAAEMLVNRQNNN